VKRLKKEKLWPLKMLQLQEESEYISLEEAGQSIGVSRAAVSQALINNRIIKKIYSIKIKK
jgi:biotin operon repressor